MRLLPLLAGAEGFGKWDGRALIDLVSLPGTGPSSDGIVTTTQEDSVSLPIVLSHGMGDACMSPEFIDLITVISEKKDGRSVMCIGDHGVAKFSSDDPFEYFQDIWNGFFGNLNMAVDYFADQVKNNPDLSQGFNVMGFSQGNLIVRGYIQRYNNPPVRNFVSIHGPLMGVGGLPGCDPSLYPICKTLFKYASVASYTQTAQAVSFQADYVRNPLMTDGYLNSTYLPDLNNEIEDDAMHKRGKAEDYKRNFASLNRLILVKADKEMMVFPTESEWFGFYEDGSYDRVLKMEESPWYKNDAFGLRTLNEAGKIEFVLTQGSHCQLNNEEFHNMLGFL